MKYNDEYDYYVTLTSARFSSLFPNIVKHKNDKFYYLKNDVLKTLTFSDSAYEVNNINRNLQLKITNEFIKLVINQVSAKCKIFLKQGYKIDFTRNDTFKDILNFEVVIVDQPLTKSPKICNLVISTNIYIHLDIAKNSIFQLKLTNIIYSFPNNIALRHLINLNIRQNKEHQLGKKYFSDLTVDFTDQNNCLIDFIQSVVTLTFEIRQV